MSSIKGQNKEPHFTNPQRLDLDDGTNEATIVHLGGSAWKMVPSGRSMFFLRHGAHRVGGILTAKVLHYL